ncbi:unnamed protein product [Ranitomeya imitator]|uniref:NADP-dependent oxidoreductase domain-containing protein n=1 Tax=Ranitomeya imitator TaxID=111125 RepID=A0ABN9LSG4_9NEOB|nr:unnamed protein product [Ranitomeya imitator]
MKNGTRMSSKSNFSQPSKSSLAPNNAFSSMMEHLAIKSLKFSEKRPQKTAIDLGYRHIDCAYIYGNEVQIGNAIRAKISDGVVRREDVFYTGKLWCTFCAPELVRKGLEKSLQDLQLDYLDLFVIHWPFSLKEQVSKRQHRRGTKYSTMYCTSFDEAIRVDMSAPALLEDPVLVKVAAKYNRSPAEVAMRYILQKGIVVLAKSFTAARLKQNLGVFDFELMSEDMKALEELDKNLRYGPFKVMKDHPEYPFHDEY